MRKKRISWSGRQSRQNSRAITGAGTKGLTRAHGRLHTFPPSLTSHNTADWKNQNRSNGQAPSPNPAKRKSG